MMPPLCSSMRMGSPSCRTNDRILVWHLYQAALAGRDIYYDQRYRHSLAMRDILEEILTHSDGVADATRQEIIRYTKLFWINTGGYNNLTARKFVLALTENALADAAEIAAANGARFRLRPGETVRELVGRYAPMFFDPSFEPMVTCKTPGEGRDILEASANNLYVGVTDGGPRGCCGALPAQLARRQGRWARRGTGLPPGRDVRRRVERSCPAPRGRAAVCDALARCGPARVDPVVRDGRGGGPRGLRHRLGPEPATRWWTR